MWRDYLSFSKSERTTFFVLTLALFISASVLLFVRVNKGFTSNRSTLFEVKNSNSDQVPKDNSQKDDDVIVQRSQSSDYAGRKHSFTIELNSCDTIDLSLLPGIGARKAKLIIVYRNKIGGYYNLSQLLEVYGVNQTLIDKIAPHLTIDTTKIEAKNINEMSVVSMKYHPYLDFYQAKEVLEYRTKHGRFASMEEVLQLESFKKSDHQFICRYFCVK